MDCNAPDELTIDSGSLLSLYTSEKEPKERYNNIYFGAIPEAFEDGQLGAVYWYLGTKLLADALRRDNKNTADLLLHTLSTGSHELKN